MEEKKKDRGFLSRLQNKWKLESIKQVILVLVVFAFTGTTVLLIKAPILHLLGVNMEEGGFWKTVIYLLLVLPLYQALLLAYGFLFGQFHFFWEKEKQFVKKVGKIFSRN